MAANVLLLNLDKIVGDLVSVHCARPATGFASVRWDKDIPAGQTLPNPDNAGPIVHRPMGLNPESLVAQLVLRHPGGQNSESFFPKMMQLIHAFVISRLDYCNALLSCYPDKSLNKLQLLLNTAARIFTRRRKCDHITLVLASLHWLPVKARADFKVGLPGLMTPGCPLSIWPCCCSSFNCSACGYGTLTCSPDVLPCSRPAVSTSECSAMKSQLTFTPEVLTCWILYNHCDYYLTLLVIYECLNILKNNLALMAMYS